MSIENQPLIWLFPQLTKNQLDERERFVAQLSPYSEEGLSLMRETENYRRNEFLTKRLSGLIKVYFFLEEMGVAAKPLSQNLSPALAREWVAIVNLSLENKLREGEFKGDDLFDPCNRLFGRLLKANRELLAEASNENIFFRLAAILRGEIYRAGVFFPHSQGDVRKKLGEHLLSHSDQWRLLQERMELSWVE